MHFPQTVVLKRYVWVSTWQGVDLWWLVSVVNLTGSRAAVLNLWVVTPQGSHINYPAHQILTLQFIIAAKLQLWNSNGVTSAWGTRWKGHGVRKLGNHCSTVTQETNLLECLWGSHWGGRIHPKCGQRQQQNVVLDSKGKTWAAHQCPPLSVSRLADPVSPAVSTMRDCILSSVSQNELSSINTLQLLGIWS